MALHSDWSISQHTHTVLKVGDQKTFCLWRTPADCSRQNKSETKQMGILLTVAEAAYLALAVFYSAQRLRSCEYAIIVQSSFAPNCVLPLSLCLSTQRSKRSFWWCWFLIKNVKCDVFKILPLFVQVRTLAARAFTVLELNCRIVNWSWLLVICNKEWRLPVLVNKQKTRSCSLFKMTWIQFRMRGGRHTHAPPIKAVMFCFLIVYLWHICDNALLMLLKVLVLKIFFFYLSVLIKMFNLFMFLLFVY